jgi:hypothetical protein
MLRTSGSGRGERKGPLTYSNIIASLALFVALGGVSWAATDGDSVHSGEIEEGSIRPEHLHASAGGYNDAACSATVENQLQDRLEVDVSKDSLHPGWRIDRTTVYPYSTQYWSVDGKGPEDRCDTRVVYRVIGSKDSGRIEITLRTPGGGNCNSLGPPYNVTCVVSQQGKNSFRFLVRELKS